jgi:hypothetical protein
MAKPDDKNHSCGCGPRKPDVIEDNSEGINAPSTTAKNLMSEDGYVENNKVQGEK